MLATELWCVSTIVFWHKVDGKCRPLLVTPTQSLLINHLFQDLSPVDVLPM